MEYKVKKGDVLSRIAQKYTTGSYQQLASYNKIQNANKIVVGQIIKIPESILKREFIKSGPLPKEMYRPKEYKYEPKQFSTTEWNYVKLSPKSTGGENKSETKKVKQKKISKSSSQKSKEQSQPVMLNILKSILGEETGKDIHGVLFKGDHSIKERFQMLSNGIQSKLGIGGEASSTIKSKVHKSKNKKNDKVFKDVMDQMFANESRYGDTIKVDKDFYIIPESINLNSVKLGSRNRGSRDSFNTKGGLISTYKQILPFEVGDFKKYDSEGHINHFFGYDKSGSPKVGPLDIFGPGDTLTQVYYSYLLNIPKDNNGEYLYGPGSKNAKNRKSPLVDLRGEPTVNNQGQSSRKGLLIMTGHKTKNFSPDDFGMAGGGAYIVKAGNELRLIRGSVNNVMKELELIQKNHKGHPITLYEVDNGSYNRGLRPLDNNYSAQELAKYDAQNTDYEPGGHFFYIKRHGGKLEILKSLRK